MKYNKHTNTKRILLILILAIFMSCKSNNTNQINAGEEKHEGPIAIVKNAPFIHLQLKVQPFSPDSILAKAIITNSWDNDLVIYKPLLPYENYTEFLYGVMEKTSYKNVAFNGHDQESYLNYEDGPSNYINPKLDTGNFVILQPNQSIEVVANIAKKFQFKEFLKKGQREFKLVYHRFWPYIVNGKQVTEMDSTDHQMKPVYFIASLPKNDDPDSMRVDFRIP